MSEDPWNGVERFSFPRLRNAARAVEAAHERRAGQGSTPSNLVDELRQILSCTDEASLHHMVILLSRRHVLAIPDLLEAENEPELIRRALTAAERRMCERLLERVWRRLVDAPLPSLEALLRLGVRGGFATRAPALCRGAAALERWVGCDSTARGMLDDFESSHSIRLRDWLAALPPLEPAPDLATGIGRAFLRLFLAEGRPERHDAEDPRTLLNWADQVGTTGCEAFFLHYLASHRDDARWSEIVVKAAFDRYQPPHHRQPVGFWRRLEERSPGIVLQILNWLALRTLRGFFESIEDPNLRFEFWRSNFARRLIDARVVGEGVAVLMRLPPLVVVEFRDIGNAAYIYPECEWERLVSLRAEDPGSYKDRERLMRDSVLGREARIIHKLGWQEAARRMVQALLGGPR